MDTPVVHVQPTEYSVSCLPEDNVNAFAYEIKVAYRGRDLWAVLRHCQCLGKNGKWDYEPTSSSRTDKWLASHRFPLDQALELAKKAAPKLSVNGYTVADALTFEES